MATWSITKKGRSAPLRAGQNYSLHTGSLATNGQTWSWTYDYRTLRSEAVHVNLLGYTPAAPAKYAYVYHWTGDTRGLDLKPSAAMYGFLCSAHGI